MIKQWTALNRTLKEQRNNRHDEEMQVEPQETPTTDSVPEPAPEPIDPIKEAEKKKEAGNTAFRAKKYQEAIEQYTEAIGTYICTRASTGHSTYTIPYRLQI